MAFTMQIAARIVMTIKCAIQSKLVKDVAERFYNYRPVETEMRDRGCSLVSIFDARKIVILGVTTCSASLHRCRESETGRIDPGRVNRERNCWGRRRRTGTASRTPTIRSQRSGSRRIRKCNIKV